MIRREKRSRKFSGWGPEHRKVLERGGPCLAHQPPEFFKRDGGENVEGVREAWTAMKDEILAAWDSPGRRPSAWWWFDSPEPRNSDMGEAEQLDGLGLLTPEELAALKVLAVKADAALHKGGYQELPFRRSWAFWRFCHRRRSETPEAVQLVEMGILSPLERQIKLNPRDFLAGRLCGWRSRANYLDDAEMDLLKLWPPQMKVK